MPGKKKVVEEKKMYLGRPGNTLKMGIVGLPNVGKSSIFNLLSSQQIPSENYPFCTIDPNMASVNIPDDRYNKLVEMWQPRSRVPAQLNVIDIAGLVPGASEGRGLGNAFLSHINATDGIFQVLRAFDDEDVIHTEGDVNPVRDMEIIRTELIAKDIQHVTREIEEKNKVIQRTNDKQAKVEQALLTKVLEGFNEGKMVKDMVWSNAEIELLNSYLFLTAKPIIYIINLSEADYIRKKNKWLAKIAKWINENGGGTIIPISVALEQTLSYMDEEQKAQHLHENNTTGALDKVITTGYSAIHLIHFFTSGEDEVRCWTIREGTVAKKAAGVIHTDFEKGFICAEITKYTDFVELGSDAEIKANGLLKQAGKDHVIEDGDIIFFRFNAPAPSKAAKK